MPDSRDSSPSRRIPRSSIPTCFYCHSAMSSYYTVTPVETFTHCEVEQYGPTYRTCSQHCRKKPYGRNVSVFTSQTIFASQRCTECNELLCNEFTVTIEFTPIPQAIVEKVQEEYDRLKSEAYKIGWRDSGEGSIVVELNSVKDNSYKAMELLKTDDKLVIIEFPKELDGLSLKISWNLFTLERIVTNYNTGAKHSKDTFESLEELLENLEEKIKSAPLV